MANRNRLLAVAVAATTLTGCQPEPYDIVAVAQGDRITLETRNTGYFGSNAREPVTATEIAIWSEQGISWRISADYRLPGCGSGTRYTPFPLVYGRLPRCFAETAPALPLEPGRLYGVASTSGTFDGYGAFRASNPIENVDWEAASTQLPAGPDLDDHVFRAEDGANAAQPATANAH